MLLLIAHARLPHPVIAFCQSGCSPEFTEESLQEVHVVDGQGLYWLINTLLKPLFRWAERDCATSMKTL